MCCTCCAHALLWAQVISVEPPNFVELEVVDTPPGVKGNTASGEHGSSSSSSSASMQQQQQHAASSVRGCVPSEIAEAASNTQAASHHSQPMQMLQVWLPVADHA
jgi:hypothetical protein